MEDPARGIYRCNREIFIDPDLFELEMKYIFEGNWIYLAHESQLAENSDYLTTWIGRQPVIVSRTRTGELAAVVNACAHRGAMVCRRKKDNRSTWTCPFHGWTYRNDGKLLKAKDAKGAGYPEQFNTDGSHDMVKVPRFESYRGFLFGSLNPDVLPLTEHLGETTKLIDMMVDQSAEGLEVLQGGLHLYLRRQLEGAGRERGRRVPRRLHPLELRRDHRAAADRRVGDRDQGDGPVQLRQAAGRLLRLRARPCAAVDDPGQPAGRAALRTARRVHRAARPDARPTGRSTSPATCCLYPNVYLMDQFSSQIRQYRPIAVDKTEVTIHCIAPKGESAQARAARIRRYEDFFNATGMATPDDLEEFRASQNGFLAAPTAPWNDMSRGATHWIEGPDEDARRSGSTRCAAASRSRTRACTPSSTATG